MKNEKYCHACGLKNKKTKVFNLYFEDSLLKSLLMNRYGLKYFKIIKNCDFAAAKFQCLKYPKSLVKKYPNFKDLIPTLKKNA